MPSYLYLVEQYHRLDPKHFVYYLETEILDSNEREKILQGLPIPFQQKIACITIRSPEKVMHDSMREAKVDKVLPNALIDTVIAYSIFIPKNNVSEKHLKNVLHSLRCLTLKKVNSDYPEDAKFKERIVEIIQDGENDIKEIAGMKNITSATEKDLLLWATEKILKSLYKLEPEIITTRNAVQKPKNAPFPFFMSLNISKGWKEYLPADTKKYIGFLQKKLRSELEAGLGDDEKRIRLI